MHRALRQWGLPHLEHANGRAGPLGGGQDKNAAVSSCAPRPSLGVHPAALIARSLASRALAVKLADISGAGPALAMLCAMAAHADRTEP